MVRAKAVPHYLRLINSLITTGFSSIRPLSNQVIHLSLLTPPQPFQIRNFDFLNSHQRLFLSSQPNSIVQLLLANEWSNELQLELGKSYTCLTHETVLYVLKKLDHDPPKASGFFNWVCEQNGFKINSSLYDLILRILAHKDSMKLFWITLKKMKENGFQIDEGTYMTILARFKKEKMVSDCVAITNFYNRMLHENAELKVVGKVADIILSSDWSAELENNLEKLKFDLADDFVIRVLKEIRNSPLKALEFFRWVGKLPGYQHNTVTYNAITRVLARGDSIGEFWSIVEEMKSAFHEIDIYSYIKITRQFHKKKMVEDAVMLFELMMNSQYKPSLKDCNMLLKSISLAEKPNLDLVFRVAKKYESAGHSLSKAVYDGIHRSLTSVGKFDEAEKIVRIMRNAGYNPDNITYSQLVFGLCKTGRLEEACEVLDEMEAHGCQPDIKTWTILIQGHCAANEVGNAFLHFSKMIEKGCDPDGDLLDVLIDGFVSEKKIDGAYQLFLEMVNRCRVCPWQATFKRLIEALLGVGKFEEAMDLLRLMKNHNYPPFADPFAPYISKFGTVDDAADFLRALSVKQYPSSSAYLHIFKSFFQEGRYSEAKDLLYKCPHHIRTNSEICQLFGSSKSESAA